MSVCLIRPAIDEGNVFYAHDKLALSQDVSSIALEYSSPRNVEAGESWLPIDSGVKTLIVNVA